MCASAARLEHLKTWRNRFPDEAGVRRTVPGPEATLQASAAFRLELLVLPLGLSAFREPLERLSGAGAAAPPTEPGSWAGPFAPSSSSCSRQHSSPPGGRGRSPPSWWALQKELGQSWQKASEFFPQTSQWCHGQSQRPAGHPHGQTPPTSHHDHRRPTAA